MLWDEKDDFRVSQLADKRAALCADVRLGHLPQATHWIIRIAKKNTFIAISLSSISDTQTASALALMTLSVVKRRRQALTYRTSGVGEAKAL